MTPQLAAQIPFALVIVGMFLTYGTLVRRGVIREKAILTVGAGIALAAALLAFGSVYPEYKRGAISLPLALFNPFAMLLCSTYCILFSYRLQRTADLATYLVGDTKIILRTCPPSRLPPADALLLPANTLFRPTDGAAFLYGAAAGTDMTREAQKAAPAVMGKVVATGSGKLAVGRVFHVVVCAPMGIVKADSLRKGMENASNQARKAGAESVVVPLSAFRGLPFQESASATIRGVLKHQKAFAEIVLVVGGGRYEKAALAAAERIIGPTENAPLPV